MGHAFTRRMTLEVAERRPDRAGGQTATWTVRGGLWAELKMRSGTLRQGTFGRTQRTKVELRMPTVPEGHEMRPVPGDRLRDGSQLYEVQAVEAGRGHVLIILATTVPAPEGMA